jgi:hypothetical protein
MSNLDTRPMVATLTITIGETSYAMRPLRAHWYGLKAFELRKADGTTYVVSRDGRGRLACECGDHVWRHEGTDSVGCKHCIALKALNIL